MRYFQAFFWKYDFFHGIAICILWLTYSIMDTNMGREMTYDVERGLFSVFLTWGGSVLQRIVFSWDFHLLFGLFVICAIVTYTGVTFDQDFYTYFDTPPQLFHQIQKMSILLSYTFRKWKDSENSEKCKRGCQNTCKRTLMNVKVILLWISPPQSELDRNRNTSIVTSY